MPYGLFQTTGETCAKFGSDRFRNVDLYKVHTHTHAHTRTCACTHVHMHIRTRTHRATDSFCNLTLHGMQHLSSHPSHSTSSNRIPQYTIHRTLCEAHRLSGHLETKNILAPASNRTLDLPGRNIFSILTTPVQLHSLNAVLWRNHSISPLSRRSTHCNANVHIKTDIHMGCFTAFKEPVTRV